MNVENAITALTPLRVALEVAAVIALTLVGSILGALTPWIAMSPILGMVLPLLLATHFLRRQGQSWRDLGLFKPLRLRALAGWTGLTLLLVYTLTSFVVTPLIRALGAPPLDISLLQQIVEGDTVNYLIFLIPVSWGSAAIGEEMLARGFLLDRFAGLAGVNAGIVLQAVVFALGHFYQGLTGMINIFVIALIMGWVYMRAGRNLAPVMVAHGVIDTVGMTLLYLGYSDLMVGIST